IVDEVTTLRCHLEACHAGKYCNWAKGASFLSKLPGDIKKQKAAVEEVTHTLDRDLSQEKLSEWVIPYLDKLFHQVVVEWLVATDQPIYALEYPKFKELIDIASHTTNGVEIPGHKAVWVEIMHMFKIHLTTLKTQLNV
ncbi:hypothetical protein F5148DRAFT_955446, partial [Russula earlei]